jgi:iron complex transport system substrate-binding protein
MRRGRRALLAIGLALGPAPAVAGTERGADGPAPPARIVSLNPSLTDMLLVLGVGDRLVGVDDWSARQHPELEPVARVGGLHSTSLEAVAALAPDLVVLVPSVEQREVREGLAALGIECLELGPVRFEEVLDALETLGVRVGRAEAARDRVSAIRAVQARVEHEREGRPRLRGVLVLTRDPLYVAGGGSFIDEMLDIVGVENLGRELEGAYPRASLEWLVARHPGIVIDASGDPESARAFWSRWPSLPAVRDGRVVAIPQGVATLPGPHLDRGLELLARTVAESGTDRAEPLP